MNTRRSGIFAIVAACLIAGHSAAFAQTVRLTGTVSSEASRLPNFGDVPSSQNLTLEIWFKPHHQDQLTKLLADQQDPKSPRYRHWLTGQEYGQRFGMTQLEFNKIVNWLTREGFQVTGG